MNKNDIARAIERTAGMLGLNACDFEQCRVSGIFRAKFVPLDGIGAWETEYPNVVTVAGKIDMLDKYLAGSAYTAAWYVGLISSTSYTAPIAADTAASHAGWLEAGAANAPTYSNSTRVAAAWAAAAAGAGSSAVKSLSGSGAVFNISGAGTVKGSMLVNNSTKDGTAGILWSAGAFTDGDKTVSSGTLTVTYSATLT